MQVSSAGNWNFGAAKSSVMGEKSTIGRSSVELLGTVNKVFVGMVESVGTNDETPCKTNLLIQSALRREFGVTRLIQWGP